MKIKFNYKGFDVTISDTEGVCCADPVTQDYFKRQYEDNCNGPTTSPAAIIGITLTGLGIEIDVMGNEIKI